jgi:excisionase family DNA binding protein
MNSAFSLHEPTSSNNAVPQQHDILEKVEELIEFRLNNSLLYRVQCVTCEEASILLSVDCDTIREWIKGGKLTASKVGREWTIRVLDIDKMLTASATVIRINDKRFKSNRKNIDL